MMHWLKPVARARSVTPAPAPAPLPDNMLRLFDDFTREEIEQLPRKLQRKILADRKARVTARLRFEVAAMAAAVR